MPLNLMERSASLTLLKLSDTFILVDLYQIPPVLVKVQQFPTLAAINVFFWRFFRHWNRPTSFFCSFQDVDHGQRPFSTNLLTLAAANVFFSSIFRRWLRPTSQFLRFRDIGRRKRLFCRNSRTLV